LRTVSITRRLRTRCRAWSSGAARRGANSAPRQSSAGSVSLRERYAEQWRVARGSSLILRILSATGVGAGSKSARALRTPAKVADRVVPSHSIRIVNFTSRLTRVTCTHVVFVGNASVFRSFRAQ